ncbi:MULTISPECIES: zinc ribbon domain-containing protein [unclassified Mycobacterium]|uniref:zinc ribbon domain-containing protein n=1 Tax=unclassified Mycobacterium TaxID=2642494 RepID=UPI0029C86BAE|nr:MULTISPECIES: zinc ribbon domain-containing protein [unclassified Mycobacterium]
MAVIGLVVLITVAAAMRWQAPLVGLVSLGMPLLFLAYLYESNAVDEVSRSVLLVTATLSVGLGVGWALGTDAAVARADDAALGIPVSPVRLLVTGLAIPLGFVILMLAPVVLARLRRASGVRESFDGFTIGSLAGYCFTAAGTLTRLAPQFAGGTVADDDRSAAGLVVAAVIQGLAIPLVAAAVAGAVGATLWCTQRTDTGRTYRWYSPSSPTPSVVGGVLLFLGLGVIDLGAPSRYVQLGLYALTAVLALFALRIVLKATALADTPDDAASRTSRSTPPARLLLILGGVSAVVVAVAVGLSLWLTPPKPNYVCPPDCGRPPISKPVATYPRFTPDTGEFSVAYPGEGTSYEATFEPNGVVAELLVGDGGTLRLFGEPAAGRTPRQIADDLVQSTYPDATTDYELPNALVGYQLGYGVVADFYPADSIGDDDRLRILVMVAVKNDFALVAAAAGPYHEFSPDFGSGHPSGTNFFLALDMAKYVNSFSWRGDPPR